MGHQQLLLIILATVIVIFAIMIGIKLYISNSVENNRDQIVSVLINLSSNAQAYYKRQGQYGGGAGSYDGWDIPDHFSKYEARKLKVKVNKKGTKVTLTGIGNEIGKNGKGKVRVRAIVKPTGTNINVTN